MLRVFSPRSLLFISVMIFGLLLASCGDDDDNGGSDVPDGEGSSATYDEPITFADPDYSSPLVLNRAAQFILEEGYGYETDTIAGTTQPLFQGVQRGDIDITLDIWAEQNPAWEPAVEAGDVTDLGTVFDDNEQGWYIPTYMIEGDEERGIEPMAPDLQHVDDLPQYADLFEDPGDPAKGRIYIGVPGWDLTEINEAKMQAYGLNETFNAFLPGSSAALMTSAVSAYQQGEPWIGHLWEPHWILSQLDMTLLDEPEYTEECWEQIYDGEEACSFPVVSVHKAANPEFVDEAPDEVIEFFESMTTTSDAISEALRYMQENDTDEQEAGMWFLREYEDMWAEWVPEDVADKVREALDEQ